MLKFNLQLFANLDEVIAANAQAFEGSNVKDQFTSISTKLNELGYDILINNKKQAEFIPASRLSEVVTQRDTFKGKVEDLNAQLLQMQKDAGDDQKLKDNYQNLIDQNNKLLEELENTRINTEIIAEAKDAIDARDVIVFVNFDNIKVDKKGQITGVKEEVDRLRQEKPHLFGGKGLPNKGGMDVQGGHEETKLSGMNAAIRRAAGRVQSF